MSSSAYFNPRQSKMRAYVCLIFIALAYATEGAPSTLLIGCKNATIGKYPYQVSLQVNEEHVCSGSIISNDTVLTATECFTGLGEEDNVTVLAGTNFLGTEVPVHKVWKASFKNEVAVVKLFEAFKYSVLIQPIDLKTSDQNLDDEPCILTGWGRTKNGVPNYLQEIDLKVYPQEWCSNHWGVTDNHICTFPKTGEGTCGSDLGGPLVANGVQIGIYSFDIVYVRVSKYIPWIYNTFP